MAIFNGENAGSKNSVLIILFLLATIIGAKLLNNSLLSNILSIGIAISIFFYFDNLFWATFIFIYASNPGGLFSQYTFGVDIGSIVIDFSQVLFLVLMVKVWYNKPVFNPFYKPFITILAIVVLINFINGVFSGFTEPRILFRVFKLLLPLSFIYIFPRVIRREDDFVVFFRTIFPFVLIAFACQLIILVLGVPLSVSIFGWESVGTQNVLGEVSGKDELSRYVFSIFLQTISLMGCMYYLDQHKKSFSKYYLGFLMFVCFFSVLLSGTRSWTIGYGTAIFFWIIMSVSRIKKFLLPGMVILILVLLFLNIPVIKSQFTMAIKRISTIELFIKGDITAGETSSRFDLRGPDVMQAFSTTNPLIGAGYSEFYFNNSDGHVGHQSLLLQSGYLGYILLNLFILFLIVKQLLQYFLSKTTSTKEALAASSLILFGLYVIFPGLAIFSYMASPETGTFYGVYLTFAGYFSHKTRMEDALIKLKQEAHAVR